MDWEANVFHVVVAIVYTYAYAYECAVSHYCRARPACRTCSVTRNKIQFGVIIDIQTLFGRRTLRLDFDLLFFFFFFYWKVSPQWHRKEGRKELDFQGWGGRAECVVSFHLQQLKGEPRPQEERKSFLFSPQHLCVKKSREKSEAMRNLRWWRGYLLFLNPHLLLLLLSFYVYRAFMKALAFNSYSPGTVLVFLVPTLSPHYHTTTNPPPPFLFCYLFIQK